MSQITQELLTHSAMTCSQEKTTNKWFGAPESVFFERSEIRKVLEKLDKVCYIIRDENGRVGIANSMGATNGSEIVSYELISPVPSFTPEQLGDPKFKIAYRLKYNYMMGAMANGIASAALVIAAGKSGMLASFGAGGLVLAKVEEAIDQMQDALPNGPYAVNLIHSPNEEALEREATELFLRKGVKVIEASAFMNLTPHVVRFRAAGLRRDSDGSILIENRVIAKVSRVEVAALFLKPAPSSILDQLVAEGMITAEQAALAQQVPMADDITVEADSGGHTDKRSLVCLLPTIIGVRNEVQAQYNYKDLVRVGAAGGIGTPESLLSAYSMGAAYVVTGSINQACKESGSSDHVRKLLAQAAMSDVMMAAASDMFELGVKLQVLKKGTLFGMRANKLYDLYVKYEGIEEIPAEEKNVLEKQLFKNGLETIWKQCISFFQNRDPEQITRAQNNPKRKMALIFRWYLGLSSSWANEGKQGRELDYQVWCGPAMGAFNQWTKNSRLALWENRYVADIGTELLKGAAYLFRIHCMAFKGIVFDPGIRSVEIK